MANDLSILIKAQLDEAISAKEINKQLKRISKDVNINIGINSDGVDKLQKQINDIHTKVKNQNKDVSIIDTDKSKKEVKQYETEMNSTIRRIKNEINNIGTVKTTQLFGNKDDLQKFSVDVKKANGELERLNYTIDKTTKIGDSHPFKLNTRQVIDNTEELNKKLEHQLNLYKQRAQIDANNLTRRFDGQFDTTELNNWQNNVNKLNKDTPNLKQNMDNLGMEFKRISSEVRTANNHVIGFREQLAVAFQRVPIWGLSTGAIYGSVRALKNMTQQIIEVDTALTSLARVTDLSEQGLNDFLQESIRLSDELSNKLSDVLTMAEEFSRLGFEESELIDITGTAQVMQNISDLDAKETVDALTSAMLNFNIAGEESIKISDQFNEIDNNFAVTTQTLATGLQRSASTARTFGVEMEDLLGYITAVGSTTRESGSKIGNGMKTILSRITTLNEAETVLNDVNVSIKDMEGNVLPVNEILADLASRWGSLSDSQRQNVAVINM